MDKKAQLDAFLSRCFAARVPVYLVCDRAGVSRATPSRWKKRPETISVLPLRKLEDALAWFENAPAVCGVCDRQNIDPGTWSCTFSDCGMRARVFRKEAA